jgi:hypothetical protein
MQLNESTLHTVDSAARIGADTVTGAKHIRCHDVFEGSMREGDRIVCAEGTRWIILSVLKR